jgi:hypothetical protein
MVAALEAGLAYVAIVFAVGFALGAIRVLVLVPGLGEVGGVLVELPIMLAVSWLVCGRLLARFAVPGAWRDRLTMGGIALTLLMAAELAVSILAFDRTVAEHLGTYRSGHAALGLAAQIAFAAFPLVRLRDARGRP